MLSLALSSLLVLASFEGVQCIRMPLERRSVYDTSALGSSGLGRRDGGSAKSSITLINSKNSVFVSTVTVGGASFSVQMGESVALFLGPIQRADWHARRLWKAGDFVTLTPTHALTLFYHSALTSGSQDLFQMLLTPAPPPRSNTRWATQMVGFLVVVNCPYTNVLFES